MHNIGIIAFPKEEGIKHILSRATKIQKMQGRQKDLDQNKSLAIKKIQSKSQSEYDQYIYHKYDYHLSRQVMYGDISRWWIAKIYSRSYSQTISIWQRIGIKSHA